MSIFTAKKVVFHSEKIKYETVKQNNHSVVDVAMVPLIELLNKIPGVVTTDCCAGHPEKGITKLLYIGVVLQDEGERLFPQWFERVEDKIAENSDNPIVRLLKHQLQLKIRTRRFKLVDGGETSGRTVSVHIPIRTEVEQTTFIGFMFEAAQEILDEYALV